MAATNIAEIPLPAKPSLFAQLIRRIEQTLCPHALPVYDELDDMHCPECGKDVTD